MDDGNTLEYVVRNDCS